MPRTISRCGGSASGIGRADSWTRTSEVLTPISGRMPSTLTTPSCRHLDRLGIALAPAVAPAGQPVGQGVLGVHEVADGPAGPRRRALAGEHGQRARQQWALPARARVLRPLAED